MTRAKTTLQDLETVLQKERAALLVADFKALDRLWADKERALAAVSTGGHDAAKLKELHAVCAANQTLIKALEAGLTDARQTFVRLTTPPATRVYATGGSMKDLGNSGQRVSQKL